MIARTLDAAGRFTRRDAVRLAVAAAVLMAALTAVLGFDLLTPGISITVGDVAPTTVRAPRAATYVSDIRTAAARDEASRAIAPQYDYSEEKANAIADAQAEDFRRSAASIDAAFASIADPFTRRDALLRAAPNLSQDALTALETLEPTRWPVIRDEAARVLKTRELTEIRDTEVVEERSLLLGRFPADWPAAEHELGAQLIAPFLVPNSSYSDSLTAQARKEAAQAVEPVSVSIAQNAVVIDAGRQATALDVEAIHELGLDARGIDLARGAGWLVLSALLVLLLLAWIWRFRRELWHRNNALLLIGLLVLVAVIAIKVFAGRSILPFFLPVSAVGVILAILLGAGPAMAVQWALAVVAGAANAGSLELASYTLLGGVAGIIAIRRGDRLQVFLQAGLAMAVVNAAVVLVFSLLGQRDMTGIVQLFAASLVAAGAGAVAAAGLFAVLGSLFGILTVFQLMELANPTQPLLRRLLTETPGTYHHALMVGNLAERAAEAIGADPLLSRVAAYYHDIGKLSNPLAFIENQAGGENLHDDLDPAMSARILRAHVADGIDLAYRAKLPKALIAYIPQHHGTARMGYFLEKARDEAAAPVGGRSTSAGQAAAAAVDDRAFRHSGPKPQTKEAAILMLADSVEASVRSLSSHEESAIRAMVSRIITERLEDGQFDECDLTLRDVERVRAAFVAQLLGMYHQRIAYPQSTVVELEARREKSAKA